VLQYLRQYLRRNIHVAIFVDSSFTMRLFRGRSKKREKNVNSPEFGRDHVARGSSGLKPLRRRAPSCLLSIHTQKACTQTLINRQNRRILGYSRDSVCWMVKMCGDNRETYQPEISLCRGLLRTACSLLARRYCIAVGVRV